MKVNLGVEFWVSETQIAALLWYGVREGVLQSREEVKRMGTYTAVKKVLCHLLNADICSTTALYQEYLGVPEYLR